ncbi:hypothetical protein GB931_04120 [Modestobacter sp. I12A-02628]|uniref:DNA-directed RNA polymerase specialized sigma24 family protein n=1 Tax=Goekera deserti TaxID=2497753 RepID=A0A7K3WII5_9ACTN|nr:hypothetical protein [Goekera deserti]MPQ97123.1 hypothetical protein [Goekera deserti]NDI46559.1 hypothetical protein [Goekera deserti]NEL56315.1 hypothetical protein [Goekera deserti]
MPDGARFAGFVAEQWRPLLATAYLLTGAEAPAADLVTRALDRARPAVHRLPADADESARHEVALRGLVRAHLGRGRWPVRGDGLITGVAPDAWWVSPADAESARRTSAALDRLDRAQRLALVLRHHENLDPTQVGRLLAVDDPAGLLVAAEREVGDPAQLPDGLEVMAARCTPRVLTDETARAGADAHRRSRRRRWGAALAAVLALVAAGVVLPDPSASPDAVAAGAATSRPPEPRSPVPEPEFTLTEFGEVYGRTRGPLATDETLLAGALARDVDDYGYLGSSGAGTERRVAYAGDVGGTRWVLVVSRGAQQLEGVWLRGPAGAAAEQLEPVYGTSLAPDGSTAVVDQGPDGYTALVLAAPGDQVAVSDGLDVAPDGTVSRSYRQLTSDDGVATGAVDRPTGEGVRYTVTRDGRTSGPQYVTSVSGVPVADLAVGAPRSGTAVSPDTLSWPVQQVLSVTGWALADVDVSVLGSGPFPAEEGLLAEAAVVAVTLPGGAIVTVGTWRTSRQSSSSSGTCASAVHPAGTDLATLAVATRCPAYPNSGTVSESSLVLTAVPPGGQTGAVTVGRREPVTFTLEAGWGTVLDRASLVDLVTVDGQVVPLAVPEDDVLTG